MTTYYLYTITNKLNSKRYVGLTKNPAQRWYAHHYQPKAFAPGRVPQAVDLALRKYGVANFEFRIICVGSRDYISDLECRAIQALGSLAPCGYNLDAGGLRGSGEFQLSSEAREKSRRNRVYRPASAATRKLISMRVTGRKASPETLAKKSLAAKNSRNVTVDGRLYRSTSLAAKELGIDRSTLRLRIRQHGSSLTTDQLRLIKPRRDH